MYVKSECCADNETRMQKNNKDLKMVHICDPFILHTNWGILKKHAIIDHQKAKHNHIKYNGSSYNLTIL